MRRSHRLYRPKIVQAHCDFTATSQKTTPQPICMSYGISLGQDDDTFPDEQDMVWMPILEAYSLQLYHFIAEGGLPKDTLQGKTVLEVGCGRGRGSAYVARAFKHTKVRCLDGHALGHVAVITST